MPKCDWCEEAEATLRYSITTTDGEVLESEVVCTGCAAESRLLQGAARVLRARAEKKAEKP